MHRNLRYSLSLLAICLLAASCSKSESVSYKSGDMTHTFMAGSDAGKGSDFLLPIYPGATATGEVKAKADEEQNSFMIMSSADSVDKIAKFYREQLKKDGWTVSQQQMLPELMSFSVKKDKLEGNVMLSSEGKGKTSINLSVAVEPEGTPEVSTENFIPDKLNPPTD